MSEIRRFEIERDKAAKLAKAVHNANQHFPVPIINSKWVALGMLAWVAGRIYLPMAKDVMRELQTGQTVAQAVTKAEPIRSASVSDVAQTQAPIVPVSADDAALESWLPGVQH